MTWKPTEGLRRAGAVMEQIEDAMRVSGAIPFHKAEESMFLWRAREIIAKALDQALADGSEQDALNAVVGNGLSSFHYDPEKHEGTLALKDIVPPTADPVGLDMPDFPQPITEADYAAVQVSGPEAADEPAPKKRGRPKGSTNKAKKKARAAKKTTAEQSSVVEAQAEPPAGEAS